MKKQLIISSFVLAISASWISDSTPVLLPKHFPEPVYDFSKNEITDKTILLGRTLFFDPILPLDSSISCASCHSPYNSFAHVDHDLSHGINDQIGNRNAPALMNLAWQKTFMWDGAVNHLDMQALAPISHPKEMGEEIGHVVDKLKRSQNYQKLFADAFTEGEITGQHTLLALAHFQLTLVAANSKYDRVQQKKEKFTEQERQGYFLFKMMCNRCHREPLFSTYEFRNIGLPVDTTLNDYGRMNITQDLKDSLLFKIPTLRNIERTFPYMHDGRFNTLNEVYEHYESGMQKTKTFAPEIDKSMALSAKDRVDLTAFLLTLTDDD